LQIAAAEKLITLVEEPEKSRKEDKRKGTRLVKVSPTPAPWLCVVAQTPFLITLTKNFNFYTS